MALGAFLAGMIVNQSAYSHRAAIEALPMRDAFAVLFFVSVGMLFNPWNFNQGVVDDHGDLPCYPSGPDAQLSRSRRPLRGDRLIPNWRVFLHSRITGKRAEDPTILLSVQFARR
jgi:hypothetical protein